MHEPTLSLSEEHVAFYQREGYLVVADLITPVEVEQLREIFHHLFANKTGREDGNQYDLAGTQVADAGLVHLKGLTKLKRLSLQGSQVTRAGVAELKKALPKCSIRR